MLLDAFIVLISTLLAKGIGFLRDVVMASQLGLSSEADLFFFSQLLVAAVSSAIGAAIGASMVPTLALVEREKNNEKLRQYIAISYGNFALISLFGIAVFYLLVPSIVDLCLGSMSLQNKEHVIFLISIMMTGLFFSVLVAINAALLQFKHYFAISSLVGIPQNAVLIIYLFFFYKYFGLDGLAIATIFAVVCLFLFQMPFLLKEKLLSFPVASLSNMFFNKSMRLLFPALLAAVLLQLDTFIMRSLASSLPTGNIAAISLANRLIIFLAGLFVTAITTISFPRLAKYADQDRDRSIELIFKMINGSLFIMLPITIITFTNGRDLVALFFQRGVFDSEATKITSHALRAYAFALPALALRDISSFSLFSQSKTKYVFLSAILCTLVTGILGYTLLNRQGSQGLVIANVVGITVGAILQIYFLIKLLNIRTSIISHLTCLNTLRILLASCAMFVLALIIDKCIGGMKMVPLVSVSFTSFLAISFYFILCKAFHVNELTVLVEFAKRLVK